MTRFELGQSHSSAEWRRHAGRPGLHTHATPDRCRMYRQMVHSRSYAPFALSVGSKLSAASSGSRAAATASRVAAAAGSGEAQAPAVAIGTAPAAAAAVLAKEAALRASALGV